MSKGKIQLEPSAFDLESTFKLLRGTMKPFVGQFLTMPLGAFAGLQIVSVNPESCTVRLPGGWRTQNPFKTTYWAAQGMAAEMATGVIPIAYVRASEVPIRMILAGTEAAFTKRCKTDSRFEHQAGQIVLEAMSETLRTGRSVECLLESKGYDEAGDCVSSWFFKWSFRARTETLSSRVDTVSISS